MAIIAKLGRRDDYLLKALEAEVLYRVAEDRAEADAWERIMVGYLELADIEMRRVFGLQPH
jgi:hypothetical protein